MLKAFKYKTKFVSGREMKSNRRIEQSKKNPEGGLNWVLTLYHLTAQ